MGKRQQQFEEPPVQHRKLPPLKAKGPRQERYLNQLRHCDLVFGLGTFGTGKTYIPARYACSLLEEKVIDKIIVTRPMITSEEDIGFLPGKLEDKFAPYFAPIREIMDDHLGPSRVVNEIKNGKIQIAPIGFLRGHTFKNCFVLFDEAQNTTVGQMKLFLSRIGESCQACVAGDLEQMDIEGKSGLEDAIQRFEHLPEVGVTRFQIEDCVRSGLAKKIAEGYSSR